MTKKEYGLTVTQREDLMTVYRKVVPYCHSQEEVWERVVKSPAPRYYVSARQAWEKLRRMIVGDFSVVDNMSPPKKRLYYSLFHKYLELSQRRQFLGKSLWFVCQFLVTEPAPEFFMKPKNLKFIFSYYKRYGKDYKEMDVRKRKLADENNA